LAGKEAWRPHQSPPKTHAASQLKESETDSAKERKEEKTFASEYNSQKWLDLHQKANETIV
jgi:hypothetical protein